MLVSLRRNGQKESRLLNLRGLRSSRCVEGAFDATSSDTPKLRNGVLRDDLKNGCGRGWAICYKCNEQRSKTGQKTAPIDPGRVILTGDSTLISLP